MFKKDGTWGEFCSVPWLHPENFRVSLPISGA